MLSLPTKKPYIIAHRGASAYAPENTLVAALLAHRCHADMWELDVSLSKDMHPVIFHDSTLNRTTNISQKLNFSNKDTFRLCDFSLSELKTLDAGSWYAQQDPFQQIAQNKIDASTLKLYSNITIPTLEEALIFTKAKNWLVNVEIKDHSKLCGHQHIVSAVLDCIQKLDMVDQVLLSSFQHEYLIEAHKKIPELSIAVLADDAPSNPLELCKSLNAQFYHPNIKNINKKQLKPLNEEGIGINVWTAFGLLDYQQAIACGATGIITAFPGLFKQYSLENVSNISSFV